MSASPSIARPSFAGILPAGTSRSLTIQALLLGAAAFLLPAVTHALGLAGASALPMHWPVLLAGLCYGARSGALLGALVPIASAALSGMPPFAVVPAMSAELAMYGALAGIIAGDGFVRRALAVTVALVVGRLVFVAAGALSGISVSTAAAMLVPGTVAALLQVALLPPLAGWWVARESRSAKP